MNQNEAMMPFSRGPAFGTKLFEDKFGGKQLLEHNVRGNRPPLLSKTCVAAMLPIDETDLTAQPPIKNLSLLSTCLRTRIALLAMLK